MESTETEQKSAISANGFDPDIKYPLIVQYCGGMFSFMFLSNQPTINEYLN